MSHKNDETTKEGRMMNVTDYFTKASSTLSFSNPLLCRMPSTTTTTTQNNKGEEYFTHETPLFNLQDSMAALEIMDPIMDCCEIPVSDENSTKTKPPRNAPSSLKSMLHSESLPWEHLTLKESKIIALETLSRLESNLRGASVAESTYTCLYAHDGVLLDMGKQLGFFDFQEKEEETSHNNNTATTTNNISKGTKLAQICIFASSLSLVKLTETIRAIVMHADIYEEEDYSISSSSFTFCNFVREDLLRQVLKEALHMLQAFGREEEEEEERMVLMIVLYFYQSLFEVCASLAKLTSKTVRTTTKQAQLLIRKCVSQLDELSTILSTTAASPETNILNQTFDSNVNRRLLGNAPVRKVQFLSPLNTIQSLRNTLHEIDYAVCDLLLLEHHTLSRIQRQLSSISSPVNSSVVKGDGSSSSSNNTINTINILGRSLIVLNLYFDDLLLGQYVLSDIIASHMKHSAGVPHELVDAEYGKSFLHRLGKPLYDTLKVLTLNRNRQRAYMDALMMREWSALQREATAVDYYYREDVEVQKQQQLIASSPITTAKPTTTTPYVTNYVLGIGVWLMEHHLGIGVELDLFCGEHDLSIAYWYWDFLLSTRLNIVTSMRKEVVEQKVKEVQRQKKKLLEEKEEEAVATEARMVEKGNVVVEHNKRNSKGKKKGKKGKSGGGGGGGAKSASGGGAGSSGQVGSNSSSAAAAAAALAATSAVLTPTEEDAEDDMEFMLLGLRRLLCRGIVRFLAALNQAGLVKPPIFEFTTHQRRFEKRFESFSVISQPPPLTYDDYCQGSDFSSIQPEELLASAAECFRASKAAVDKLLVMLNKRSGSSSALLSSTTSMTASDEKDMLNYLPVAKEEVMSLAKVCVGNSLFLHKLTQQVRSGEKVTGKVLIDFSAHKQFCSIKIT
uniref:Uncharacterized protein n=1 Tax=Ditylum brightwellii TaxID=49249 RepID=A0A7S1ZHY9_9STRA|mmetsp:Transcript_32100/g.47889  ORF Transcript_32100/g.47889 Transcript_32100/m.47889 type:complete len:904 (+) Transcript_32100:238-2949(+)